jgi:hypothetical protein
LLARGESDGFADRWTGKDVNGDKLG